GDQADGEPARRRAGGEGAGRAGPGPGRRAGPAHPLHAGRPGGRRAGAGGGAPGGAGVGGAPRPRAHGLAAGGTEPVARGHRPVPVSAAVGDGARSSRLPPVGGPGAHGRAAAPAAVPRVTEPPSSATGRLDRLDPIMTETSAPKTADDGARSGAVRVRFCPSPTGTPHVGLIRTALFNWAYARHVGGTFVFRIEGAGPARDSEESYQQLLDAMRWLGLDWDEGVEVGGPHEPYRQSQRMEIYADVAQRLLEAGHAYESFSTPEEIEARHRAAGRDPKLGYD